MDYRNLNWSISNLLNNVANLNNDWDFSWELDYMRNLNNFLIESFDFINFRYLIINNYEFLNNSRYLNNSVSSLNNCFSKFSLDLLKNFTNIRSNFFNLSNDISNNWLLDCTIDLLYSDLFNFNLNNSLDLLNNLDNLLNFSIDCHNLLNNAVNWNRYLNRYNSWLFNFYYFLDLDNFRYDSLNFYFSRNLNSNLDYLLIFLLHYLNNLVGLFNWDDLLNIFLYYSIDLVIDILDSLDLDNSILNDGNLNKSLDLSDSLNLNNSVNNFLNDLRYLDNLLYNSWDNYDFLDNLLDLNNFWYLNHLLNNLVDSNSNFFNSLNGSWDLNDLLNNNLDWVILSDEVIDWLLNFNNLVNLNNLINISNHFNYFRYFSSLNDDLSSYFRYSYNLFLDYWYFNSSVNDFLNLFDHRDGVVHNLFNFFYSISVNDFLFNNSNLFYSRDFNLYLDNLLDSLWYFDNLLNSLDDWYWFFNNNLNNFRDIHDLVDSFFGTSPLNNLNWLLDYTIERLDDLNNLLNYFLLYNLNLNNLSNNSLNCDYLLSNDLHLLDLRNSMVDNFFNNHWFFDLNNFLFDDFDLDNFGNLDNPLNDLFNDSGHFYNFFSVLRYLNNFLNDVVDDSNNLNWDMNDFLNLLNLNNLNWFFHNSFDWYNLRDLNNSFDYLLNYLLDFNNFWYNSEDFQNIIDINYSHNLSINHTNNSLINVKDKTCFSFQFLKLF